MKKLNRTIIIALVTLALLSPIGIFLPHVFKSGGAWGEWSKEIVKKQTGYIPKGMDKNAGKYKAPLPDYSNGKKDNTIGKESVFYILSGLIGIAVIAFPTWLFYRHYRRNE